MTLIIHTVVYTYTIRGQFQLETGFLFWGISFMHQNLEKCRSVTIVLKYYFSYNVERKNATI